MFFGFSRVQTEDYMYNLIPLSTLKLYIENFSHFPLETWLINLAGNIGVFIPFGVLLPLCFQELWVIRDFLKVFLVGILILELCQLSFRVGSFDVDDILLNTVGALTGFVLLRIFYIINMHRSK
ncbi:VanZ family protein [Virgibacillus sp. MSP4-1]|nr:VanZ family protein [Virgibacillus sp. MSP4-1]